MKKIIAIVALFASMAIAGAQQLGVTGGLTLSKMNGISNPKDTKAVALYSAGVLYKANLGAGFAIQPELLWQVKGANVQENVGALDNLTVSRSNNVELGLGLQWGPDLLAFRPYLFVEPFLGYSVGGKESQKLANADFSKDKVLEARNKLEYGVGGGIGVEIASHIQLSFQLFRNMGPLYKADKLGENKYPYEHLKNYQGIRRKAVVFCSASYDIDPKYNEAAREVVRALHAYGWTLVSGGSFRGTMGVIADEMDRLGGDHIGVLPRFMKGLEYPHLTELVWTDTMAERKERMREGTSAVIALPGGIGTLDELIESHVLVKLGRYEGKLLVLNVDGFFDPFKALLDHYEATGMLTPSDRALIVFADTVPELAEHLK